jgi:hypothetical protein
MIDVYVDAMMRLMSVTIDSKIFREDKIIEESPLFIACDFSLEIFQDLVGGNQAKKHETWGSYKIFEDL